jgi:hypothetical protein
MALLDSVASAAKALTDWRAFTAGLEVCAPPKTGVVQQSEKPFLPRAGANRVFGKAVQKVCHADHARVMVTIISSPLSESLAPPFWVALASSRSASSSWRR